MNTVGARGQNEAKKHSKNIIYAQLDGKQSSWPPLKGLRPSASSLPYHFLRHEQKINSHFGEDFGFLFGFAENRMVGGSSPSKTVENQGSELFYIMGGAVFF